MRLLNLIMMGILAYIVIDVMALRDHINNEIIPSFPAYILVEKETDLVTGFMTVKQFCRLHPVRCDDFKKDPIGVYEGVYSDSR